jgi:hypothetical protein
MNYNLVEINEDHPNDNKQNLFIQRLLEWGSNPISLAFGKGSMLGRGVENTYSRIKGEDFRHSLTQGIGRGQLEM